jgi:hypothetical protein
MPEMALVVVLGVPTWSPAFAQTASPPSAPVVADPFAAFVEEAAHRFAVPKLWVRLVMRAESAGDPAAVSPKGAIGLMQIMPKTYARLSQTYGLGADPLQPHDNILAGAAYLREVYDRYGSPGFLAAYNAGPARYESHLATGQPLPQETQLYLARLAPMVAGVQAGRRPTAPDPLAWTHAPLFIVRASDAGRGALGDRRVAPDRTDQDATGSRSIEPVPVDVTALVPQSNGLFVRRAPARPPQ